MRNDPPGMKIMSAALSRTKADAPRKCFLPALHWIMFVNWKYVARYHNGATFLEQMSATLTFCRCKPSRLRKILVDIDGAQSPCVSGTKPLSSGRTGRAALGEWL